MFKLKFHLNSSCTELEAIEIDDGDMSQSDINSLCNALDKLKI